MLNRNEWPEFYPSDMELPPKDSVPAEGVVYRLVNNCPPTKPDFKTTHEDSPNRHKKFKNQPQVLEMIYATSFWLEEAEAREKLTLAPVRKKYSKVAKGSLMASDGKMRISKKEKHVSVWFRNSAEPQQHFSCIKGDNDAS